MTTNHQRRRDERRRDKEARRRMRQDREWKRQHPRREITIEEQLARVEAQDRKKRNLPLLSLAATILAMGSSK